MSKLNKLKSATPCLGICSTTFGDEVCKGCKRFSHEVVSWTKYSLEEREIVNDRIEKFKVKILKDRFEIIDKEKKNGLSTQIHDKAKEIFLKRYEKIDFDKYYLENPFQESCQALYHWSPIADELKTLDEKIVLNSMKLKWNLIIDEFKNLTKKLYFN